MAEQKVANASPDLKKLHEIVEKYKGQKGSLIRILQDVQSEYNYVPFEAIKYISEKTGEKEAKIFGVITFYTQFRTKPVGKNLIMLCQGTACHVNGSDGIIEAVREELGTQPGDITADGLFTYVIVACLGCCSLSPVMMINGETYGNLTPQSAKDILKRIREENADKKGADTVK